MILPLPFWIGVHEEVTFLSRAKLLRAAVTVVSTVAQVSFRREQQCFPRASNRENLRTFRSSPSPRSYPLYLSLTVTWRPPFDPLVIAVPAAT